MDHREIGKQLNLFMFSPLSPGCPIWLPKGTAFYNELLNLTKRRDINNGYTEVRTPILWKKELYSISGHIDHYLNNMFSLFDKTNEDEGQQYFLKPMNCPGHMEIFRSKQWSYRDLPVRFSEYGTLHRNEISGALGGLTRCRSFCQDDAHLFCKLDDILEEIQNILRTIWSVYEGFQLKIKAVLSTRPKNFMGQLSTWDIAEGWLCQALNESKINYEIASGEGAFYGPKIDILITDSIGREWQTGTIQLDFQLPIQFGLKYIDVKNNQSVPIVIHRAIFGSFERFIGILLEHFQGKLPFNIAPVSVKILAVSEKVYDYSDEIEQMLKIENIRCESDKSNSTLSQKIVFAYEECIPMIVIIGEKEKLSRTVTIRENKRNVDLISWVKELKQL